MRSASVDRRSERRRDFSDEPGTDLVSLHQRLGCVLDSLVQFVTYTEEAVFAHSARGSRAQDQLLTRIEEETAKWEQSIKYAAGVNEALVRKHCSRARANVICSPPAGTFKVVSDYIAETQGLVTQAMCGRADVQLSGKVWEAFTWLNQRIYEAFFRDNSSPLRGRKSLQTDDSARERENASLRSRLAECEAALSALEHIESAHQSPDCDELEQQLQDAQATIVLLQADIDRFKHEKPVLQNSRSSLAEDLEVAHFKRDLERIRKERDTLKAALAQTRGRQDDARKSFPGRILDEEELEKERARSRNFLQALQQKEKELEEARNCIEQQKTMDRTSSRNETPDPLKEELIRFLALIKTLESEKAAAENQAQEHLEARLKAERELKMRSNEGGETVLAQLRLALEEKLTVAKTLTQTKMELTTVKEHVVELAARKKELESALENCKKPQSDLYELRGELQGAIGTFGSSLEAKVAEMDKRLRAKAGKMQEIHAKFQEKLSKLLLSHNNAICSTAVQINNLKWERDAAVRKAESMIQDLDKKDKEVSRLKLAVSKLSNELESATRERHSCLQAIEKLRITETAQEKQYLDLQRSFEHERSQLQKELLAAKSLSESSASKERDMRLATEGKAKKLAEELREKDKLLEAAMKDLEEKQRSLQQMNSLELRLNQISASQYDKDSNASKLESEIQSLKVRLRDSESKCQKLETDLRKSTSDLSTKVKELVLAQRAADSNEAVVMQVMENQRKIDSEMQQLKTDVQKAKDERHEAHVQLAALQRENGTVKAELAAAKEEVGRKEKSFVELRSARDAEVSNSKASKEKLHEITKKYENIFAENRSLREQNRTQAESLSNLASKLEELEDLKSQFAGLSSTIESYKSQIADTEKRRKEAEISSRQAGKSAEAREIALKSELEEAKTRLEDMVERHKTAVKQLNSATEAQRALEKQLKSATEAQLAYESELEESRESIAMFERDAAKQAEDCLDLRKEGIAAKRKIGELEGKVKMQEGEISQLQEEIRTYEDTQSRLSHELQSAQSEIHTLKQVKKQKLKAAPQESVDTQKAREVSEELEAKTREIEEMREKVKSLTEMCDSFKSQLQASKQQLAKETSTSQRLSNQIDDFLTKFSDKLSTKSLDGIMSYCQEIEREVQTGKRENSTLLSQIKQRDSDVKQRETAWQERESELQELLTESQQRELESQQREKDAQQREKDSKKREKETQQRELELQRKLDARQHEVTTLELKIDELEEDLQQKSDELESIASSRTDSHSQESTFRAKMSKAEEQLRTAENELKQTKASLEEHTEALRISRKELTKREAEVKERTEALRICREELTKRELEAETLNNEGKKSKEAMREIADLQKQLRELRENHEELTEKLELQDVDLFRSKQDELQLRKRVSELEQRVSSAKAESQSSSEATLRRSQEQVKGLKEEVDELEREQEGLIVEIRTLQMVVEKEEFEMQTLSEENIVLSSDLDSAIQFREECEKLLVEARQQLQAQSDPAEISSLRNEIVGLKSSLSAQQSESANATKAMQAQIKRLSQENDTLKSSQPKSKQSLQALVTSQKEEIDDLKQTVEELTRAKQLLLEEFGGQSVSRSPESFSAIRKSLSDTSQWLERAMATIQDRLTALDRKTVRQWGNCTLLIERLKGRSVASQPADEQSKRYQRLLAEPESKAKQLQKSLADTPKGVNPFHLADFIEDASSGTETAMRTIDTKISALQSKLESVCVLVTAPRRVRIPKATLTQIFTFVKQQISQVEFRCSGRIQGLDSKLQRVKSSLKAVSAKRKTAGGPRGLELPKLRAEIQAAEQQLRQAGFDLQRKSLNTALSELLSIRVSSNAPIDPSAFDNSEITVVADTPELRKQESELGPLVDTVERLYRENEEQTRTLEVLTQENAILKDALKHGSAQGSDRLAQTLVNMLEVLPEQ